jgi:hypothetical protein
VRRFRSALNKARRATNEKETRTLRNFGCPPRVGPAQYKEGQVRSGQDRSNNPDNNIPVLKSGGDGDDDKLPPKILRLKGGGSISDI